MFVRKAIAQSQDDVEGIVSVSLNCQHPFAFHGNVALRACLRRHCVGLLTCRALALPLFHCYCVVQLKLYRGHVYILGRKSDKSLYDEELVSMDVEGEYDPKTAEGTSTSCSICLCHCVVCAYGHFTKNAPTAFMLPSFPFPSFLPPAQCSGFIKVNALRLREYARLRGSTDEKAK